MIHHRLKRVPYPYESFGHPWLLSTSEVPRKLIYVGTHILTQADFLVFYSAYYSLCSVAAVWTNPRVFLYILVE